jgi:hypothetical protein
MFDRLPFNKLVAIAGQQHGVTTHRSGRKMALRLWNPFPTDQDSVIVAANFSYVRHSPARITGAQLTVPARDGKINRGFVYRNHLRSSHFVTGRTRH